MNKIIKIRDLNSGEIFGSLVCNNKKILSSEYEEKLYNQNGLILLDQDEVIEEDDDYEKLVYLECVRENKDIEKYQVVYFDIEINSQQQGQKETQEQKSDIIKKNGNKKINLKDENENEELEALQDKLNNQREIFAKLVKNSLESLKILGKIFSLKTDKKNFVQNSIDKLKTKIELKKKEDNDQLEDFELKLKTHFWNIHEVYLNLLKKQQDKTDQFYTITKTSCQSFSEYQNRIIFEGCCNQQRIEYIRDLFLKFVKLGDSDKLYKEVISAMLDVFDMKQELKQKFFENLKKIQLINLCIQLMKQTEKKFKNFKDDFQNNYESFNLNCVCVQETAKLIVVTSLSKFTHIKNAVVFKKKKKRIKSVTPDEIMLKKVSKEIYFSLFIGNLIIKQKNFLIFADKVKNCWFGKSKNKIFQISSIKVLAIDQCDNIQLYNEAFNKIFKQGFFFSYDIDLTYSLNRKSNCKLKQPKWIFYVNRGMHRIFQNEQLNEWITPVVFGEIGTINRHNFNGKGFQFSFFKRVSILDILKKDLQDPLIHNFTVSNSFYQYDFQYQSNTNQKIFMSFVISNIYDTNCDFKTVLRYFNFLSKKFRVKEFFITQKAEENFENSLSVMESFPFIVKVSKFEEIHQTYYEFNKHLKTFLKEKRNVFSISTTYQEKFNKNKICNLIACFVCFCNAYVDDQKDVNFNEDEQLLEEIVSFCRQELEQSRQITRELQDIAIGINKNQQLISQIRIMFVNLLNKNNLQEKEKEKKVFELSQKLIDLIYGNFIDDMEDLIKNYKLEDKTLFNPTNLKISFLTHNCQGHSPIEKFKKNRLNWINNQDINDSDILVVGFQEIIEMKSKNLQRIVLEYSDSHTENWVKFFKENLSCEFKLFYRKNLVGLLLLVFIKQERFKNYMFKIQNVIVERLGKLNLANKGAIFIQLDINFQTFTFVNCHLESGTNLQKAFAREESFSKLVKISSTLPQSFGVFILGDMNFRNYTTYKDIVQLQFKDDKNFEQTFVDNDELKQSQLLDRFHYKEMRIEFCPSYKFKQNSNEYYLKQGKRIPSYTDRIVYYTQEEDIFTPAKYFSDKDTLISDHRPVILTGNLKILQFDTQKFQSILDQLTNLNQLFQNYKYGNKLIKSSTENQVFK